MKRDLLQRLNSARRERKAVVVVTDIDSGKQSLVLETDDIDSDLSDALGKAFRTGKSQRIELDGRDLFLNVYLPAPRLVIIGAVHISQALATIAGIAGYAVEIIDPRSAFATPERFGSVQLYADWPDEVLASRPLDAYCALVAVTHDPKIDDFPIMEALNADCFYTGALGSRKTHNSRLERLHEAGLSTDQTDKICAPIGLDIGASSPQEIGIAIMAEVIDAFRKRGLASE